MSDVAISAHMTDTRTGESRVYGTYYPMDDGGDDYSGIVFHWTSGNYSCDCNRSLFFYDYADGTELNCNEGENIIRLDMLVVKETGKVIYDRERG